IAHRSVKQRAPLRKSFIPSRRHSRHLASRYRAILVLLLHPPPLRRPAAVVRYRRDVTDRGDLEPHGLQRSDGGLTAGPRPPHEHLDLLEPELHRLAGGGLGRRLRRERRALARALEAGATGAGPRHHVAALVGEGHDRVVDRCLDVVDAGADLAPLALLAALLAGYGLRLLCPALRPWLLRFAGRRSLRG